MLRPHTRRPRSNAGLQKLNLALLGEIHLYKTLLKPKPISTSPSFPSWIATTVKNSSSTLDTASANVVARLFNSNPVKEALKIITKNVHDVVGLPVNDVPRRQKRLRAADYKAQTHINGTDVGDSGQAGEEMTSKQDSEGKQLARQSMDRIVDGPQSADDSEEEIEDYSKYNSRIGNSSDDESHGSDVIISDEELGDDLQGVPVDQAAYRAAARSSSTPLSGSPLPSLSPSPPPPAAKKAKLPKSTNSTTFLPTLSGGYWSGSEGSNEDENEVEDLSTIKPRKNRRGQQERRAIWEKKYGANANHVKRQGVAGSKPGRDEGWDLKRGARDDNRVGRCGRANGKINGYGRGGTRGMSRSGPNSDPVNVARQFGRDVNPKTKEKAAEGPLHPSWEAKKRAKEKAGNTMVAFQGKKVTFD